MEPNKTTQDFDKQLAEFQKKLEAQFNERLDAVKLENEVLLQEVENLRSKRAEQSDGADDNYENVVDAELALLYDPFDVQNALAFKLEPVLDRHGDFTGHYKTVIIPPDEDFPEGQVLGWKSPRYRADEGWQGWQEILYGDKYAGEHNELLKNYIVNPPVPGEGENIDRYIRRKGLVLARLDKRIADARARKRELENAKRRGVYRSARPTQVARHVSIVGKGLEDQVMGPDDYKIGQVPPLAPNAVRTQLMPHNRPQPSEE